MELKKGQNINTREERKQTQRKLGSIFCKEDYFATQKTNGIKRELA
jgi:hypothetical protein